MSKLILCHPRLVRGSRLDSMSKENQTRRSAARISRLTILFFIAACSTFIPLKTFAIFYHSQFQTADLHPGMSIYEISLEPNITFTGPTGKGFGMNGHLLMPLTQDISANLSMGSGIVPFMFDGHIQYSLYPDFEGHIAFSVGGGLNYLRRQEWNHVTAYLYPTISKSFRWGGFLMAPYALLPIGVCLFRNQFTVPIKVSIGNKITSEDLKNIYFYFEVGVGIINAPTQVAFGMGFQFDSNQGI